jgi:uncharacterized repeat protein (TIGR01451 family)
VAAGGWLAALAVAAGRLAAQPERAGPWVMPEGVKPTPMPVAPAPSLPLTAEAGPGVSAAAAPAARLEVEGPDSANVGQILEYRLRVVNPGPEPLHHVRVEDELPDGARYLGGDPRADQPGGGRLVWEIGLLDPGTEKRIRVRVRPSADGELRSTATLTMAASARVATPITRPELLVRVEAPEEAVVGAEAAFPIEVRNGGSGPANRVVLQVRLPEGLAHPAGDHVEADLGTLPAGGAKTVTLKASARKTGPQPVEAFAFAEGGLKVRARSSVLVTEPGLTLRATAPPRCPLGTDVELSLVASNPGTAAAQAVRLRAVLPDGLAFGSASHGGAFDPAAHTVTWGLESLPAGGEERLTVTGRAVTIGSWSGRGLAEAGQLSAEAGWRIEVLGVPDAAVELGLDEPLEFGHEATCVIRAVNRGSGECTGLRIRVVAGEGLEILKAADGPLASEMREGEADGEVTFGPARLPARADALYRVRVRPTRPGRATLRAELTCEQSPKPAHAETAVRVLPAGVR